MILNDYKKYLYAILRIIVGFLFLWHGAQKLLGYPPLPPGIVLPWHMLFIAGPVELIGGLFVCIGLFTRWTAFIASGEMAYAYWTAHAPNALLPMVNKGELAVLYCFVFLFIASYGSGIWSLDNLIFNKNNRNPEKSDQHK